MNPSLRPGSLLSHYRVLSLLGAGGMGEVYLAHDETLGRNVALKLLPPRLTREEQRVRRFMQEARTASSLSHPHIVTIYEILQQDLPVSEAASGSGESAEAEGSASEGARHPTHLIAMEFVSGCTLRTLIYREKTDLRTLLRYLAQAADGLAKAHAAGVVHRDLKPDNIMVSDDGYAKVVDFGLAKLIEPEARSETATAGPTAPWESTQEGAVVGTVAYMSPEQVQGKGVDHRSDIFSFGSMLYEAVTRSRPFTADSSVEAMHRILRENPTPIEQLNRDVPAELRRLIRRCLAKNPDERFQSMKDLALELNEIATDYDQLTISSGSRAAVAPVSLLAAVWRSRGLRAGLVAAAVVGLAGLAFGVWSVRERLRLRRATAPFESMSITRLLSVEDLVDVAISPDRRYLATVTREPEGWVLRVRQVATGSDVQLLPPQPTAVRGIRFTPDGDYLDYLWNDPDKPAYRWLCRVPSLGGEPRRLIFDVDTAPSFSPDGKRIAFLRWNPPTSHVALVLAGGDGGNERDLAAWDFRGFNLMNCASWSPDGKAIGLVCAPGNESPTPFLVSVSDGKLRWLCRKSRIGLTEATWLPDGSGLVGVGNGWGDPVPQIWFVSTGGKMRRVTNDLNHYKGLTVSADAKAIAAAQTHRRARVWQVSLADPDAARPVAGEAEEAGLEFVRAVPSGRIICTTASGGAFEIWSLDPTSGHRVRLTPEGRPAANLDVARQTGLIAYTAFGDDQIFHVWRMDADGGGPAQVTRGRGEWVEAISPDGRVLLYYDMEQGGHWKVPLAGGAPMEVPLGSASWCYFTQDGRFILHNDIVDVDGVARVQITLRPIDGGEPIRAYDRPLGSLYRLAPSDNAIAYVRDINGVHNIWTRPLEGGEAERLTRFTEGRIFGYDWSSDDGQLILARGRETTDVVLITGFR